MSEISSSFGISALLHNGCCWEGLSRYQQIQNPRLCVYVYIYFPCVFADVSARVGATGAVAVATTALMADDDDGNGTNLNFIS